MGMMQGGRLIVFLALTCAAGAAERVASPPPARGALVAAEPQAVPVAETSQEPAALGEAPREPRKVRVIPLFKTPPEDQR